jgi:hypothetical protein
VVAVSQVGPETATGSVRSKPLSRMHSLLMGLLKTKMDDNMLDGG